MGKHFLRIFVIVFGLAILFSSCTKTVEDKSVYVDSYIHSIYNRAGVPVYNVMHTAYSFSKLSSVTVSGATGSATTLNSVGLSGYSFVSLHIPFTTEDSLAYKTTVPAPGTYTYKATYENGDAVSLVNATVDKSLPPVSQLAATKTTTDIVLAWKPVTAVEAYKVRIYSEDIDTKLSTLIYESDFLAPKDATSDLSIPFSLISFSQYLSTNLYFEVSAFIFEANSDFYHASSAATIKKYFGI